MALASKDVRLAVELAGQLGLSASVAEALRRTMAAAEKTHGANDVAALAAWYPPD